MCFKLISKNQVRFICLSSFILFIFDIIYISFTPKYSYTHPSIIQIENIIRIILTFIIFIISCSIFIDKYYSKNKLYSISLFLEFYLNNLGMIFSIVITVLQWIITLHNTFFAVLLFKAQKNTTEKYITPFQSFWIIIFGNIICVFSGVLTVNWVYMKKYSVENTKSIQIIQHDSSVNTDHITIKLSEMKNNDCDYVIKKGTNINQKKINLLTSKFMRDQLSVYENGN